MLTYYEPINLGVTIDNPHDIFMLLQLKWRGTSISEEWYLRVDYCVSPNPRADINSTKFRVNGIYIEASATTPYRKATLWLESKSLYALLVLDLDSPSIIGKSITLSPVPFGMDGKPKLPYTRDQIDALLYVVSHILDSPKTTSWTTEYVTDVVRHSHITMVHLISPAIAATTCLTWLEQLHVIEKKPGGQANEYHPIITKPQFENIFGVKPPEIYSQY